MPNKNLLVSTRKGLFILSRTQGSGAAWKIAETAFLGDSVTMALADERSGYIYAALNHGHFGVKLHRKDNANTNWKEISTPAYPPLPKKRKPDRCPMRDIEIPWNTEQIWSLVPGNQSQPGRLWCGTIPGGLFKSEDHGLHWEFVTSLWEVPERKRWMGGGYDYPGIHSICVDPRDSRHVTVAISCGGIWETKDDGHSWELIGKGLRSDYAAPGEEYDPVTQDPHALSMCRDQPDTFWVQHHNGIFRSTDGARTFTEIEEAGPSVFGFPATAHPVDPLSAWFAPAIKDEQRIPVDGKLVITRTSDGGKSFKSLTEGLPQDHAYDLVYRHSLAVDQKGQRLAFGSTTGSLWTSENEGETWIQFSSNLPPIFAVSFFE